jgi:hypothetical protein
MKLEFYLEISDEVPNIKFHRNPASGNRRVLCGQTDRNDEANRRFSQFCERAENYLMTLLQPVG